MQFSVQTPLWYKISQHQLSFREFDERFDVTSFKDTEIFPILALAALYKHSPYVEGIHIILKKFRPNSFSDRELCCLYLYWVMRGSFKEESLLEESTDGGNFKQHYFKVPHDFDEDYIYNWIMIILRGLFHISPIFRPTFAYTVRNWDQLTLALNYTHTLQDELIHVTNANIRKLYRLAKMHTHLTEIRSFLLGQSYPGILKPYRHNLDFFNCIVNTYWPKVLYTLNMQAPFDANELTILEEAHDHLYQEGDFEFTMYYIKNFLQVFGKDHPLSAQLQNYLKPSNKADAYKVKRFFLELTPLERQIYFGQYTMFTDCNLEEFSEEVAANSFEKAFIPYLRANKERIDFELSKYSLCNELVTSTQLPYYCYDLRRLIFHVEGQYLYIFLCEEINQMSENPYTRKPLPEYLIEAGMPLQKTPSFEDLWESILRRKVDLSTLLQK